MSGQVLNWAARVSAGDPIAKAVLLVLAESADQNGTVYLGQETIAQRCDTRRETINRAMKRLKDRGLIVRSYRRRDDGYRTSDLIRLTLCDLNTRDENTLENDSHVTLSTISCAPNRTAEPPVNPQIRDISSEGPKTDQPDSKKSSSKKESFSEDFEQAWKSYPHVKGRSSKPQALTEWNKLSSEDRQALQRAIQVFTVSDQATREDGKWVKGFHGWLKTELWRGFVPTEPEAVAPNLIDWDARLVAFKRDGTWLTSWGEKPGREGCIVPASILAQHKITPQLRVVTTP